MSAEQNSGCETSGWNVGGAEFRMCCPDHWLKCTSLATSFQQPATTHVSPPSDGVSGRPVRTSFAMDSKELSSISDCFGDKKAIKTPKLNTIWLELIARVLNMLIELKGDNYYSKVFKRVNYKLWNNTFWVVINMSNFIKGITIATNFMITYLLNHLKGHIVSNLWDIVMPLLRIPIATSLHQ